MDQSIIERVFATVFPLVAIGAIGFGYGRWRKPDGQKSGAKDDERARHVELGGSAGSRPLLTEGDPAGQSRTGEDRSRKP